MVQRHVRLQLVAGLVVVGLAMGSTGCGDDDDDGGGERATPATGTQPETGDGPTASTSVPKSEFCLLAKKLQDAFDPERFGEQDKEKVKETFAAFVKENGADLDAFAAAAPGEIKRGVELGVEAFRKAAKGDLAAIEDLGTNEEAAKVGAYERVHCAEPSTAG